MDIPEISPELRRQILDEAVDRVVVRLSRWQPVNPTLQDIRVTLISDLPGLIRGDA
jgi:hypothetical protein